MRKKWVKGILAAMGELAAVCVIITLAAFLICKMDGGRISKGVWFRGADLSRLDRNGVDKTVTVFVDPALGQETLKTFYEDKEHIVTLSELDGCFDKETVYNAALEAGHRDIYRKALLWLGYIRQHVEITCPVTYSAEKLEAQIQAAAEKVSVTPEESHYKIEGEKLIVYRAVNEVEAEEAALRALFQSRLLEVSFEGIPIPCKIVEGKPIDLDGIYQAIKRPVRDGLLSKQADRRPVTDKGDNGYDMDLEQAKEIERQKGNPVEIPLKVTYPRINMGTIEGELCIDLLGRYESKFKTSDVPRTGNLKVASGKIDAKLLLPGEIFSFNETVGKRTVEAGFDTAYVYTAKGIEKGIGGGSCQVSSTLYNAAESAGMQIIERHNHSRRVEYVPKGKDAATSYGTIDLRFKNTQSHPVKINAGVDNNSLTIQILAA